MQWSCYLQGHIGVDTSVFPENTPGFVLDAFARSSLWKIGLDYRHGYSLSKHFEIIFYSVVQKKKLQMKVQQCIWSALECQFSGMMVTKSSGTIFLSCYHCRNGSWSGSGIECSWRAPECECAIWQHDRVASRDDYQQWTRLLWRSCFWHPHRGMDLWQAQMDFKMQRLRASWNQASLSRWFTDQINHWLWF